MLAYEETSDMNLAEDVESFLNLSSVIGTI